MRLTIRGAATLSAALACTSAWAQPVNTTLPSGWTWQPAGTGLYDTGVQGTKRGGFNGQTTPPFNDTSFGDLIPYLQGKGVGIINASPTGMGLLTQRGVPAWHPSTPAIQEGCRKAMEHCRAKGVDIVRLALQFACDNEAIACTLVGSANPDNIKANIEHLEAPFDRALLAEVMEILENLNKNDGTTIIMVTHDENMARRTHRLVRLFDGSQVQ
jgi:hypothetical protein